MAIMTIPARSARVKRRREMGSTKLELKGQQFGCMTVLGFAGVNKWGGAVWNCICVCGREKTVSSTALVSGRTASCGCSSGLKTHRMSKTPEFRAYCHAKQRCTNPNLSHWPNYGGRGIKFLFTSFEQFFAELGPRQTPTHSLDRFPNNDGNYEPGNVRWATKAEQIANTRPKRPRLEKAA
jgi:hypothetical protein